MTHRPEAPDVGLRARLPFECPPQLIAALRSTYAVPPRAYHNFSHVEEVLGHMASAPRWSDPASVALAILFHDAIYEAGKPDNEARSAQLAEVQINAHLPAWVARITRVRELILLTARHGRLSRGDVDPDAAMFLDCDMAVLGAEPTRYAHYERAIADEYSAVPPELYRVGRAQFLQAVLTKPNIYLSPWFQARFELRARENLAAALRELEGQT
ncbi:MAG: hypothetical protein ABW321_09310 [Polyangiales bacterium]